MLRLALAVALVASPATLQARYDRARDVVEHSRDASAVAAARAEIAAVERADGRPAGLRRPLIPLPATWSRARADRSRDAELSRRLARLGARFDGWASFWVHDLATGRSASWNADASFPAASTVKLGVLAAALRVPGRPEQSEDWYDVRQLAAWSSNLAANRLVARLGYGRVSAGLRALGMRSSTYPGPYRAGTSLWLSATKSGGDAPKPPPHGHIRVTTAHDLGRALYSLQAAAAGNRYRQRLAGLTQREARIAIGLLRGSIPAGDNRGLLRPWLGRTAVAEKNGWLDDTRITAAIVYRASGPVIVVVTAYRPELKGGDARALGRDVVRLLGL